MEKKSMKKKILDPYWNIFLYGGLIGDKKKLGEFQKEYSSIISWEKGSVMKTIVEITSVEFLMLRSVIICDGSVVKKRKINESTVVIDMTTGSQSFEVEQLFPLLVINFVKFINENALTQVVFIIENQYSSFEEVVDERRHLSFIVEEKSVNKNRWMINETPYDERKTETETDTVPVEGDEVNEMKEVKESVEETEGVNNNQ